MMPTDRLRRVPLRPGPSTENGPSLLPTATFSPPSPLSAAAKSPMHARRADDPSRWRRAVQQATTAARARFEQISAWGHARATAIVAQATTSQPKTAALMAVVAFPAAVTVILAMVAITAIQQYPGGIPGGTVPARLVAASVALGGCCAVYAALLGMLWLRTSTLVHDQRRNLTRLDRTVRRQGEDLRDSREQTELLSAMREVSHIVANGHDFDTVLAEVIRVVEHYCRPQDVTIFLGDGDGQLMPRASLSGNTADAVCALDGAMEAAMRRQVVRALDVRDRSMTWFVPFDAESDVPGVLRIVHELDAESVSALAGEANAALSNDCWPAIGTTPAPTDPALADPALAAAAEKAGVAAELVRREMSAFERRIVSFVKHMTLAVRHLTLYDRATVDGLTRLFNRPMFTRQLSELGAKSAQSGLALSVIMVDIDKFKATNDTHGHLSGDLILAGVAHLIRTTIPDGASAYRFGGEEMAILCPGCDAIEATIVAEQVRMGIESADLRGEHGQRIPTTISLGIAQQAPHETAHEMLGRADAALYHSKENGRNQATVAPAPAPPIPHLYPVPAPETETETETDAAADAGAGAADEDEGAGEEMAGADESAVEYGIELESAPPVIVLRDSTIAWNGPRIHPGDFLTHAG